MNTKKYIFVLALDFDQTIVKGHMHTWFSQKLVRNSILEEDVDEFLVENTKGENQGFRGLEKLKFIIGKVLDANGGVCITTHSSYKKEIQAVLDKYFTDYKDEIPIFNDEESGALGSENLTTAGVAAMYKRSFSVNSAEAIDNNSRKRTLSLSLSLPPTDHILTCNKNNKRLEQLKKVKDHFSITENSKIVLLDDDIDNINVARLDGFIGVCADIDDKYLSTLKNEIETITGRAFQVENVESAHILNVQQILG